MTLLITKKCRIMTIFDVRGKGFDGTQQHARIRNTMAHTLFISDLHLQESEPKITQALLTILETKAPAADALYILGDFFEFWIGDDDLTPFHRLIMQALKKLTASGTPVYFMAGNRDFLIGKRFLQATGMQALADPSVINLYGQAILLSHGDCLCTHDLKHQKFRQRYNSRLNQFLFTTLLPLGLRRRIAQKIRQHSQAHYQASQPTIMDVTPDAVVQLMQDHQTTQLIHGHTHRPAIHQLTINQQPAQRIVLGSWHEQASLLRYQSDGQYELLAIPFAS